MAAGRKVVEYSYKKMFEIGGVPVAMCTTFALCIATWSGIRSYIYNPDVRRARADLHEELPGERTAKVGAAWHAYHDKRHIRNECGNVSVWRALGFDRPDPVEEYFPGATKRA
ncbi:hypothetical protein FNF27_00668 [Cafeteria roenbergensis]|uniref:Uncharacterized protein n=1 Tax=Cafeteria roenbergensis TaxID=33653 RepID=A0A5A8EQ41_CAFRO|nr:hypothetical protein FNF29_00023 [Cafeteria roenbergensis]KAA0158374.1 hypothetical protein FNF31_05444 [Cafeteria roenbergensis]KAA0166166.1 hypothetical protein FNF28_03214 [Cafeteria roenbergensis]KAA0178120.1 hypothetical protein FNF27_00668 [Cafeteria roenbergensis]|eukprot:KAA0157447.1 hypothetical protein FNF29_00023 [Cafeteria roenbergensis]